jgi:orotate phosphoribosyltransferase
MLHNSDKKSTAEEIALSLLQVGAVRLQPSNPFKWASGWNSPIYCDNRLTLSFPEVRTAIKEALTALISEKFPLTEGIAGVATAGIPQGALVADVLKIPFLYVRPKPKEHGMANLIEGKITAGQKVVVIEDLISTGGSSLKAVDALKNAGFDVLGMVGIFTYGFPEAEVNFSRQGVALYTLSDYPTLIQAGLSKGYIKASDLTSLQEWRKNPAAWPAK